MPPCAAGRNRFSRGEAGRPIALPGSGMRAEMLDAAAGSGLGNAPFQQVCTCSTHKVISRIPHPSFSLPPIRAMKNPPSPREKAWPPSAARIGALMLKIVGTGVLDGPYEKCRRYSLAGLASPGVAITNCAQVHFLLAIWERKQYTLPWKI